MTEVLCEVSLVAEIVSQVALCTNVLLATPVEEKNYWNMNLFDGGKQLVRVVRGAEVTLNCKNVDNFDGMFFLHMLSKVVVGKEFLNQITVHHIHGLFNYKERNGETVHSGLYVMNYTGVEKSKEEVDAVLLSINDQASRVFGSFFGSSHWKLVSFSELDKALLNPEQDDCYYVAWKLAEKEQSTHRIFLSNLEKRYADSDVFFRAALRVGGVNDHSVDIISRTHIIIKVPLQSVEKAAKVLGVVLKNQE